MPGGRRSNPFATALGFIGGSKRTARAVQADLELYDAKRGIDHNYNSKYYSHKTNEDVRGAKEKDIASLDTFDDFVGRAGKHGIKATDLSDFGTPTGLRFGLQRRGNAPFAQNYAANHARGANGTATPPAAAPAAAPAAKAPAKKAATKKASSAPYAGAAAPAAKKTAAKRPVAEPAPKKATAPASKKTSTAAAKTAAASKAPAVKTAAAPKTSKAPKGGVK